MGQLSMTDQPTVNTCPPPLIQNPGSVHGFSETYLGQVWVLKYYEHTRARVIIPIMFMWACVMIPILGFITYKSHLFAFPKVDIVGGLLYNLWLVHYVWGSHLEQLKSENWGTSYIRYLTDRFCLSYPVIRKLGCYNLKIVIVCGLCGLRNVWSADCMICGLYGLRILGSADCMVCGHYGVRIVWSSDRMVCGLHVRRLYCLRTV